jgi:hypothetical protein
MEPFTLQGSTIARPSYWWTTQERSPTRMSFNKNMSPESQLPIWQLYLGRIQRNEKKVYYCDNNAAIPCLRGARDSVVVLATLSTKCKSKLRMCSFHSQLHLFVSNELSAFIFLPQTLQVIWCVLHIAGIRLMVPFSCRSCVGQIWNMYAWVHCESYPLCVVTVSVQ